MNREIIYNEATDSFEIKLIVPKTMTGANTYDEGTWEQDAVCVWIDEARLEYALCHTQYLDYKSSLQSTQPIIYFDEMKEALEFAEKYDLMVEYAR